MKKRYTPQSKERQYPEEKMVIPKGISLFDKANPESAAPFNLVGFEPESCITTGDDVVRIA